MGDVRRVVMQCPTCGRVFWGDAAFCPFDGLALARSVAPATDPLVGVTVDGRYELLEVLGEGGMGRVYRARHTSLGRVFAVKVLRRDLAGDEGLAERFLHEARATAAVKHPNVVQITDFGRLDGGVPYFVMELLVGQTLRQSLHVSAVPIRRAISAIRQVASALAAAHAAGVIHRDLKPDNVFLVGDPVDASFAASGRPVWPMDPEVRVVDFGAAKIIGAGRITRAGVVYGTPHYMAPEQASGLSVDHRADIYALGVVMYELLAGRPPFDADTYMGVLTQHMFAMPEPPGRLNPTVASFRGLEAIVLRCLAKKPEERFGSMGELLTAIDGAIRAAPARMPNDATRFADSDRRRLANIEEAPPRTTPSMSSPLGASEQAASDDGDESHKQPRAASLSRHRWGFGAASMAAACFVLLVAGLWTVARRGTRVVAGHTDLNAAMATGPLPSGARTASTASTWLTSTAAVPPGPPPARQGASGASAAALVAAPSPSRAVPRQRPAAPDRDRLPFDDVGDPFAARR
jgi:serine/threonine-protein kinase